MKKLVILLFILVPALVNAQSDSAKTKKPREFQAGEYTMKQYFFVMLKRGIRRDEIKDTAVINQLQKGHMDNIGRLAKEGKLLVAGPFGDNGDWRGIFILDTETIEEAKALLQTDPAIAAGRLDYDIHPWWTAKNAVFK
jgi:uncharacterized protein YciI